MNKIKTLDSCCNSLLHSIKSNTESEQKVSEYEKNEIKMNNERMQENLNQSGIGKRFLNESFDTWKAITDEDKNALEKIKRFVELKDKNDKVLLLIGDKGRGKTHLAASILRITGGKYLSAPELIFQFEAAQDFNSDIKRINLMQEFKTINMLVIDEIGRGYYNDKEEFLLDLIINERYNNKLPTVLISNLPKEVLLKKLSNSSLDRLIETCFTVELRGESYRRNKRQETIAA